MKFFCEILAISLDLIFLGLKIWKLCKCYIPNWFCKIRKIKALVFNFQIKQLFFFYLKVRIEEIFDFHTEEFDSSFWFQIWRMKKRNLKNFGNVLHISNLNYWLETLKIKFGSFDFIFQNLVLVDIWFCSFVIWKENRDNELLHINKSTFEILVFSQDVVF
jgi:hypothetical protein